MSGVSRSIFNPEWWSGHLLEWAMKDELFKIQLFRFIDVLPVLKDHKHVTRLLKEYFEGSGKNLPEAFLWGMRAAATPLASSLVVPAIRKNLEVMAHRFIAGKDPDQSAKTLRKLRRKGLAFTVDLLGEATLSDEEADTYRERCLEVLQVLADEVSGWQEHDLLDRDHRGRIPRLNLSVKLSALSSKFDPLRWEASIGEMKERLYPILRTAAGTGALVNIDLEHYDVKALTYAVFREILQEEEFREGPALGIVVQAYLKDSRSDLQSLLAWAREFNRVIAVRLVKGAYWDYETVVRQQKGWQVPVFLNKTETDENYERLSTVILENTDVLAPAFASHNIRSLANALAVARELAVPEKSLEFQMLYGMAEPIRDALVRMGYRVRVYAPIGEMLPGMAYLVRRLLENTSNESFLRKSLVEEVAFEKLIAPPRPEESVSGQTFMPDGFVNEPQADLSHQTVRDKMASALRTVREELGGDYRLVLGGKTVDTKEKILSVNPAAPDEVVGVVGSGSRADADRAVEEARLSLGQWRKVPPEKRAEYLFRTAEIIRKQRFRFAALEVYEVGKGWREADADVCEAIDFLNYYGSEMIRLGGRKRLSRYPGELNHYHYKPRGVGVVISPWNFPLAIAAGMTAAAIAAGNCVVFKPASNSPVTGAWMVEAFREAELPPGVLQFLPGPGEEVGNHLVSHAGIDFIAFTGSKEVGLEIVRLAGNTRPGQRNVKQVIAEMGGKNAVIVDESADLDEAVRGVIASAFGFQGQKCSACSRVIVVKDIAQTFVHRLVEAARSLCIGPAEDPANHMGPVIDGQAVNKIREYIRIGESEGNLVYKGEEITPGSFVPPVIFTEIKPSHRLFREEIFGPVLSVIEADDLEAALLMANDSEYALTGGLFSRSPANIELVRNKFEVGNLYINRGITGALVGRQPFGGARMSGVGSKAGGPDYLVQFMIPRAISENTLRRGFAPPDGTPGALT
jgi:RHH-type proline utilization regulon transcriptional repressor/proline dehydrogenase/delta 1-pyrroline-5-carboxylate dehydrogenase